MTVAKIKEYVDACIENLRNIDYFEHIRMFIGTLEKINSMLDELEPNENTSQWLQHLEICGYVCDNCGHISDIEYDECPNCGARMNDELKENDK